MDACASLRRRRGRSRRPRPASAPPACARREASRTSDDGETARMFSRCTALRRRAAPRAFHVALTWHHHQEPLVRRGTCRGGHKRGRSPSIPTDFQRIMRRLDPTRRMRIYYATRGSFLDLIGARQTSSFCTGRLHLLAPLSLSLAPRRRERTSSSSRRDHRLAWSGPASIPRTWGRTYARRSRDAALHGWEHVEDNVRMRLGIE